MAGHLTIDHYLDALRKHLGRRLDVVDLLDEVEDHLRTAVERTGATEALVLERFGDPEVLARALAAVNGCPAVPTEQTRKVGMVAMISAGLWVLFAGLWWVGDRIEQSGQDWEGAPRVFFMLGVAALASAGALTVLVLSGLGERHGGFGRIGTAALVLTGLGVTVSMTVGWFMPGWAGLIGAGALIGTAPALRRRIAPRWATVALGSAWALGFLAMVALEALAVGEADEWGNHPVAYEVGIGIGVALVALGLFGLGRWLHGEEPVDQDRAQLVTT